MSEGYIKFNCVREDKELPAHINIDNLNSVRSKVRMTGMIGITPDGIGFGNISERVSESEFVITATRTGGKATAHRDDYVLVTKFELDSNTVFCTGKSDASSESMTLGVIYRALPEAGGIIHIHDKNLWNTFLDILPTSSPAAEFGTPRLADEIETIAEEVGCIGAVCLAGHEDGIIAWGRNPEEAFMVLQKLADEARDEE